jgi:hypothetical protein
MFGPPGSHIFRHEGHGEPDEFFLQDEPFRHESAGPSGQGEGGRDLKGGRMERWSSGLNLYLHQTSQS